MSLEQINKNITQDSPAAQPGALYDAAERLYHSDPSVRMVGSLARGAIMGQVMAEYKPNGERRNINAFHVTDDNSKMYGSGHLEFDGVELSTRFDRWIRTENGETHLVFPFDENVSVELPEADTVLEAYAVPVQDKTVYTLKPEVLGRVTTMMRNKRPKDKVPFAMYNNFLMSQTPTLHPELLKPFDEFRDAMSKQHVYRMKSWLRNNLYYQIVPNSVRTNIEISRWIPGGAMTPTEKEV